jgi:glutamate-1-semialdehyde 2,1-aminomutase
METYSYDRSQALFERATKVIPCGIYGHFSPAPLASPMSYPFYARSAQDAHFTDVDGHDFIDYMCAYGPMVLGYRNKVVDAAVRKQIQKSGDLLGAPTPLMVELAEYLVEMIPVAEWALFAKNGGDVTNYATMVARSATGRPKIVAIQGGYHGVAPWMQGGGHHGVTEADIADVVRIPWNDVAAFERALAENPGQIAGFISTPYHHPTFEDNVLPADHYWQRIESLCRRHGVVLIIDDVRCGFRHDMGGTNEYFGFKPDLICFCKAIGNGYPISALVGTEALKSEAAKVFFTGSYWYQAAPMAAALACLAELKRLDAPRLMHEYGTKLTDGMVDIAKSYGYHLKVSGLPSMPYLRLTDDPSMMLHQRFCAACTERGAYFTSHHNWFMSVAHTEEDLRRTLEIVDDAFTVLKKDAASEPWGAATEPQEGASQAASEAKSQSKVEDETEAGAPDTTATPEEVR